MVRRGWSPSAADAERIHQRICCLGSKTSSTKHRCHTSRLAAARCSFRALRWPTERRCRAALDSVKVRDSAAGHSETVTSGRDTVWGASGLRKPPTHIVGRVKSPSNFGVWRCRKEQKRARSAFLETPNKRTCRSAAIKNNAAKRKRALLTILHRFTRFLPVG